MKKRQAGILTAVLCVLLAGCSGTQSPSAELSAGPPASAAQTETPANPVKADAPPEEEPAPQGIADVSGRMLRMDPPADNAGYPLTVERMGFMALTFAGMTPVGASLGPMTRSGRGLIILEPGIRSRRWTAGRYSPPPCWRRRQECFIWMRAGCSNARIPLNTWAKI